MSRKWTAKSFLFNNQVYERSHSKLVFPEWLGCSLGYSNHLFIYIIKQDIHIYVAYSRPNGWTDLAGIFCGHSWVAGGLIG